MVDDGYILHHTKVFTKVSLSLLLAEEVVLQTFLISKDNLFGPFLRSKDIHTTGQTDNIHL